jgi:TraU protein
MRLLVFLLLVSARAEAVTVILAFDMPVAAREGTQYLGDWRSTVQQVVGGGQEILALLSAEACQAFPVPQRTAETLCAQTRCLEPGEYTFRLRALRGEELSPWSNEAGIDLRGYAPCQPVVVVPPSPPKPSPAVAVAGGLTAAAFLALGVIPPPPLPALPNLNCVSWKVTGVCPCLPSVGCLQVEYYEPRWLIETLKRPGETAITEFQALLDTALKVGTLPLGAGGAGNTGSAGHTNLHVSEAHVWSYPQVLGSPCTACAPTPQLALHYSSELDAATWRTAIAVPSPLGLLTQVGVWGRLYPRSGRCIHGSEPVCSGLMSARAMDIAFQPIGTPPNGDVHVVLKPTGGWSRCFQLAYPRQTPCFPAGFPPAAWETFTLSPRGTYLWVVWVHRTCCVNPSNTTCGLTLVGGQGENFCLLPSPPSP